MTGEVMTFNIYRYDSAGKAPGRFRAYSVPVAENDQLLDVLERIKTEQDGSLSYRKSCRHGICGSCAVKVNGKPVLACKTPVRELVAEMGRELYVEPLDKERTLKDLVVDLSDFWGKFDALKPYVAGVEDKAGNASDAAGNPAADVKDADYCIQCGSCFFVCPVVAAGTSFLGPAALTKAYRLIADMRDYSAGRLKAVQLPYDGVWDCAKCLLCVEACPKSINPFEKITLLHEMGVVRRETYPDARVRHARVFRAQVFLTGYINEFFLALFTLRFGMAAMAFRGLRLFLKRKLHINPFAPRSIKRYEIRKLLLYRDHPEPEAQRDEALS